MLSLTRSGPLRAVPLLFLCAMPLQAQACQTQAMSWPDPQAGARVGTSLALGGDTMVAGGPMTDTNGAAYIWRRTAGTWGLEQKLGSPVTGSSTTFGRRVALAGDVALVGGNTGLNRTWLYRRTGSQWALAQTLVPTGYTYVIEYGEALAVEGEWIAVGAPSAQAAPPLTMRTGSVTLYREQAGVFSEVEQLRLPSPVGGEDFGFSLALRAGVLVVGTAIGSQSATTGAGSVWVYRLGQTPAALEATLVSPAANPGRDSRGATFGREVATDGVRIAIADLAESRPNSATGAVHLWVLQAGAWVYEGSVSGRPNTCGFGSKLAIDGDELVVGQSCGHRVSHFRRIGGQWLEQGITPTQNGSAFVLSSLALSGQELALGSVVNPGTPTYVGQVAAYQLGSGSMPYGNGLAGTGGLMPQLFGSGCPRVGQPYSIDLGQGRGGSFALLAIGFSQAQSSLVGGTLWISSLVGSVGLMLDGSVGQAGAGGFQFPFAVPSPAYVGLRFYCQAGVMDPAASQGFALSNALEVVMGH